MASTQAQEAKDDWRHVMRCSLLQQLVCMFRTLYDSTPHSFCMLVHKFNLCDTGVTLPCPKELREPSRGAQFSNIRECVTMLRVLNVGTFPVRLQLSRHTNDWVSTASMAAKMVETHDAFLPTFAKHRLTEQQWPPLYMTTLASCLYFVLLFLHSFKGWAGRSYAVKQSFARSYVGEHTRADDEEGAASS